MQDTTPSLVQRALARDAGAVRELVRLIRPVIQARVARALLRRKRASRGRDLDQEIEDMIQQVYLGLFADGGRELAQWDPSRGLGLLGYVGLVAERDVASILRSRRQSPWTEDPTLHEDFETAPDSGKNPERHAMSRETLAAVVARLREELTERGAVMFQLLVVEERPIADVCAVMDMTPDAAYAWKSRVVRLARSIAADLASESVPQRRRPVHP